MTTLKRIHRRELPMGALGLDLHPTRQQVFVACIDGVYELDIESGDSKFLYAHESYVSNIVCFHERDQLISSGYDGALQWFDLASQRVVRHVQAHQFWSWDLARAKEAPIIASVTGQYLAGDYEYRPLAAPEPCVRVYDALSGRLISSFDHGPPTQAVALSGNGQFVAAGNLMGDVGVWRVAGQGVGLADQPLIGDGTTQPLAKWNTPDFTAFGIIKSHCQIGGIYAAAFAPNENELLVAGMGPMRDPMAGNGKQRWQRFDWSVNEPKKLAQSDDGQVGEGLMETLAVHPTRKMFVMGGRLRGGAWSAALFDLQSGNLLHSIKTGSRVTKAVWNHDGTQLLLSGAKKQSKDRKKKFGVVDVYDLVDAEVDTQADTNPDSAPKKAKA